MKSKITHSIIAIIFLLFAYFQWNDPDGLIWAPAYLVVSIMAVLALKGRFFRYPYLLILVIYILWGASYIPEMNKWIQAGMPSIAASMKAETPYIELAREFFGLLICIITIAFYYVLSKRNTI